jgi:hypothetical protein
LVRPGEPGQVAGILFFTIKMYVMIHKITYGFKLFRHSELITFGYRIAGKTKTSSNFSDLPEAHAELEKTLPEYQDVHSKANKGDDESRFKLKALRAKTIGLLVLLAEYVMGKANGDQAIMASSGFDQNKARGTKSLKTIEKLKVIIDKPGEAVTEVKRIAGTKAYAHQYTTDPITVDSVWVSKVSTSPSYTFTGLTSKEKYWFQVIAVGVNDQQTASVPVSRVIQ